MPLSQAVVVKLIGTAAAVAFVGGGATVAVRGGDGTAPRGQAAEGAQAMAPADDLGVGDAEVVVDPLTGTVGLVPRADAIGAGAAGGASTIARPRSRGAGRFSAGARINVPGLAGGQPASVIVGGNTGGSGSKTPGPGSGGSGGSGTTPGGSGTTPGGSGGSGTTPDGPGGTSPNPAPDVPTLTAPAAPTGVSAHSQGTFTVAVAGTGPTSKKLCLSGSAVNKCRTVPVRAVGPVDLTVTWSGNTAVAAPTVESSPCPGGLSVRVAGLTPGATLTVTVNGSELSGTVPERSPHQTASLCDG